jgi:hypothetical protein
MIWDLGWFLGKNLPSSQFDMLIFLAKIITVSNKFHDCVKNLHLQHQTSRKENDETFLQVLISTLA